jgi:hypothetical protein
LLLVTGLLSSVLISGDIWTWIVAGVTLLSQALFILGAGHKDLFRPIRRPRILFPVATASLMLTALLGGLTIALMELFFMDEDGMDEGAVAFWVSMLATWGFWATVLYAYTRNMPRHQAILNMARLIFAGSIAELLATVPSHIFVSRRSGCFAGISTAIGLFAGLLVMIWSFGPAIFLLFLCKVSCNKERGEQDGGFATTSTQSPFQFRVGTLLLAMLLVAVVSTWLRSFWGQWPVAALAAWGILLLVVPALLARPWIMLLAVLVVFAGMIYVFWGDWYVLTVLVIPTGLLGVVLLKLVMGAPPPRDHTLDKHTLSQ